MKLRCAQCHADFVPERDEAFLRCPYCHSFLFLDGSQTYKRLALPASIPASRAAALLRRDARRRDLALPGTGLQAQGFLYPFWGIRGTDLQDTLPAFSPVPFALNAFRLPASKVQWDTGEDVKGFKRVDPGETRSLEWMDHPSITSFSLYAVPFYRFRFGAADSPYEAFVDGVKGTVLWGLTPPSSTIAASRRYWLLMLALLAVTAGLAGFLPGFWVPFIAANAAAVASYPLFKKTFVPAEAPK